MFRGAFAALSLSLFVSSALFGGDVQIPVENPDASKVAAADATPPRVLRFSASITGAQPGVAGIVFSIYKDREGGAALWTETQNVDADANGQFTVMLGATNRQGLPLDLFRSGEARWLGIQRIPENEQPRLLLASVPYALKAADADTLGGKPLSAFVMNEESTGPNGPAKLRKQTNGAAGYIAKFVDSVNIDNSIMYEGAGRIGLYTTSPQAPIHIATAVTYRNLNVGSVQTGVGPGILLENTGTNTSSAISDSNGLVVFVASSASLPMSGTDLKMVLRPSGFLGLGLSNPQAPLHIGNVASYRNLNVAAVQSGAYPGLMLENTTTNSTVAFTENHGLSVYSKASSTVPLAGTDLTMTLKPDAGFVVFGAQGTGSVPISGPGTRMMWYPGKGTFRAGAVDGTQWDESSIGTYSFAEGWNDIAAGPYTVAIGYNNNITSSAYSGLAAGWSNVVNNGAGIALGQLNLAGYSAVALGYSNAACGSTSIALGYRAISATAAPAGGTCTGTWHSNSFIFGDGTNADFYTAASNEFAARASGGFRFRTSADLSTGCNLPAGSGTFSCTSDRNLKEDFEPLDGETVLTKLSAMPIETWLYKTEPGKVRHAGPTAQDFYAAFGLGNDDKAIGHFDEIGVALRAIQALEERTSNLRDARARLAQQEQHIQNQDARIAQLETKLEQLMQLMAAEKR